ncbi:ATP/GTP-binding protein [Sphingobacterium olei]|uniref:ATP/GTP-binding protein n=1 Tax=Sphingobacterium olei TaxID=2571155 RepID=A0A4U0N8T9_9SPHI|nr:ATP-binding protein [Sphingobacterium olei]TJZ50066.1 ATP/GTP-binding protein [Sphingobacterium olei]
MKKIVISGTYCTGKTTLALALSLASGIPATHALTMREILPMLYPGKTLRQCTPVELITLGMKRFGERIESESDLPHGFISDGCPIQEWLYGSTRLITGAYPDEKPWKMKFRQLLNPGRYRDFQKLLSGFEGMAKEYTCGHYDQFIHLPVEFDFVPDGHRPTSERFRQESEKRLLKTYDELLLEPEVIRGNHMQRLQQAVDILGITPLMSLEQCVLQAEFKRSNRFDSVRLETRNNKRP